VASFSTAILEGFDKTNVVDIETTSAKGAKHSVPIWIVVANGVPYVRSVRGPKGRWYRELTARGEGAIVARGKRTPVKAIHDRTKTAIDATSEALRQKYRSSGQSLASMLKDDVLDTTVRLEPLD
jgi:hypothetical protein